MLTAAVAVAFIEAVKVCLASTSTPLPKSLKPPLAPMEALTLTPSDALVSASVPLVLPKVVLPSCWPMPL